MEILLIYLNHHDVLYIMSLAEAKQYEMMVDMAGRLLFKQIGHSHFKLIIALYAIFFSHGISHSFVTDNDTMNSNTTETSPVQIDKREEPVENFTQKVQNLTSNESAVGNHSKGILNSTGLSFSGTQLSVDMEYTRNTSANITDNFVSMEPENSVTEIPSTTTETGLDKRYDYLLELVFKFVMIRV